MSAEKLTSVQFREPHEVCNALLALREWMKRSPTFARQLREKVRAAVELDSMVRALAWVAGADDEALECCIIEAIEQLNRAGVTLQVIDMGPHTDET